MDPETPPPAEQPADPKRKRASKYEIERRVRVVVSWILTDGDRPDEVVPRAAATWGISDRQAREYRERAVVIIRDIDDIDRKVERAKAAARYDSIYLHARSRNELANAIGAEKARCALLGLNAPTKLDVDGAHTVNNIPINMPRDPEVLRKIGDLLAGAG